MSDLVSLLLHIRCCIYAVHFVAHALHLCFALTPSSLEGLPLFGLRNFVRLLCGAFLCSRAVPLLVLYATVVDLTTYVHFVRRCALCSGGDCFGSVVVLRS